MFIEVHAKALVVKNLNTGKEVEFTDVEAAHDYLFEMREDRPEADWQMLAVLDV